MATTHAEDEERWRKQLEALLERGRNLDIDVEAALTEIVGLVEDPLFKAVMVVLEQNDAAELTITSDRLSLAKDIVEAVRDIYEEED